MDGKAYLILGLADDLDIDDNMVRCYGWGPRSGRLVDAAPHGHWCTTTFVAGLREDGVIAPLSSTAR